MFQNHILYMTALHMQHDAIFMHKSYVYNYFGFSEKRYFFLSVHIFKRNSKLQTMHQHSIEREKQTSNKN